MLKRQFGALFEHPASFAALLAPDGTGSGLTIVQEIARAHGWSIGVTTSEAGGARFEVTDVTEADP